MSANDKDSETIAEKQERLQALLAWFDGEDFRIEQVSDKFQEAKELSEQIERLLEEQKNTITVLKKKFDSAS